MTHRIARPITGTTLPARLWARLLGLTPSGLDRRLRRWPLLRALQEPNTRGASYGWKHPLDEAHPDRVTIAALGYYHAIRHHTEDHRMPFDYDTAAASSRQFERALKDIAALERARPDRIAEIVATADFDDALGSLLDELSAFREAADA